MYQVGNKLQITQWEQTNVGGHKYIVTIVPKERS